MAYFLAKNQILVILIDIRYMYIFGMFLTDNSTINSSFSLSLLYSTLNIETKIDRIFFGTFSSKLQLCDCIRYKESMR